MPRPMRQAGAGGVLRWQAPLIAVAWHPCGKAAQLIVDPM